MKPFFCRVLLVLIFVFVYLVMFLFAVPWLFIGSLIYFIKWLLTGTTNGLSIIILGGVEIPIIFLCIMASRLNLSDDFKDTSFFKEIKKTYLNDI